MQEEPNVRASWAMHRGSHAMRFKAQASDSEVDMYDQLSCLLGDGRSASMTAPNGPSQQACILQSMREAGNSARDINLAECHGTGTALGDPIEVGALRNVMDPRDTTLALTSSKSNIGHLEGSAGIAGFLKCVGMLMAGTCPPNAHLYSLNPHLDVKAFPCFFDTEAIDSGLNSALTGVSSFGFGGTNGRCDVWGAARFGPNKCGKVMEAEVDQIYTLCPITLGKIDYLTGEPLTRRLAALRRGKRKADVLRDELSRYDVSRYAYDGGFRYRQQEIPEGKEDFPPDSSMFICGSWNGFSMEEMDMDGDNLFSCIITLSQERYELFDLCMDQKEELALFPAVDRAGQIIAVEGPAVNKERKRWCIDGRDTEMCAGTVIQITFQFRSVDRMTVTWKEISEKRRVLALPRRPSYFVSGSFTKWRNVAMKCVDEEDFQEWSTTFRIGQRGREDFHILKEGDKLQAIYPTFPLATGSGEEACGPDEYGSGRHFQVKGMPNDEVELSLYVEDGQVTVRTFTAASRRSRQWESIKGWARHSYSVIQPGGLSAPMTMDARSGVFTCMIDVGQKFDKQAGAFCFHFQVAIDGDSRWVFHPRQVGGLSGEVIVNRPPLHGSGSDLQFTIYSPAPGRNFKITLDLTAEAMAHFGDLGCKLSRDAVAGVGRAAVAMAGCARLKAACDASCSFSFFSQIRSHRASGGKVIELFDTTAKSTMEDAAWSTKMLQASYQRATGWPEHFEHELDELRILGVLGFELRGFGPRPPHRFRSGAVYVGQWCGNQRHGFGRQTWPDGAQYEGTWSNSSASGQGRFKFPDGAVYVGQWRGNRFHGAMVRTTWQMDPPIVASGPAAKRKVELPEITFPFEVHGYRDGVGVEVCNALMRDLATCEKVLSGLLQDDVLFRSDLLRPLRSAVIQLASKLWKGKKAEESVAEPQLSPTTKEPRAEPDVGTCEVKPAQFSRLLYTNPVCILSSCDASMRRNLMTISWLTPMDNQGRFLCSLNKSRHSAGGVLSQRVFVLNVPTAELAQTVLDVGGCSGSCVDKIERFSEALGGCCRPGWEPLEWPGDMDLGAPVFALAGCVAHLVVRVQADLTAASGQDAHHVLSCATLRAVVRRSHWDGKIFSPRHGASPYLTFFGSVACGRCRGQALPNLPKYVEITEEALLAAAVVQGKSLAPHLPSICFTLASLHFRSSKAGGAPLEAIAAKGRTALACAAVANDVESTRLLLDGGALMEALDDSGRTPLALAASYGNADVTQVLVDAGAKVNARDKGQMTPLLWAAVNGNEDVVRSLVASGADIEAADDDGMTAMKLAGVFKRTGVQKCLAEASQKRA
ncbi:unnamed protein product [Effrenium voratum]|nr:unnamed protein product [Effrenium voratum]